jgi:hypothetical protein
VVGVSGRVVKVKRVVGLSVRLDSREYDRGPHLGGVERFSLIFYFTPFSPQFCGIQLLVVTILSHCYNPRTGSGETKAESHASSETQPNQAALLLNTARLQPGSQPHQCVGGNTMHLATLVSTHCAQPATGVAGA